MKITINRADDQVTKDGLTVKLDTSSLPAYVSVIQWDTNQLAGWIEFINDGSGVFLPNQKIVEIAPFQYLLDAYDAAKAQSDAA